MALLRFIFQTPAFDNARSAVFFKKTGWKSISSGAYHGYTDGSSFFHLNPLPTSRPGLIYLAEPDEKRPDVFVKTGDQWMSVCPSGIAIYWQESPPLEIDGAIKSLLGNHAGLTVETMNIEESIRFYRNIGLEPEGSDFSHGFVSLKHPSGFSIVLLKTGMCPHSFINPSISYFNGKEGNAIVLQNLQKAEVEIYEKVSCFNSVGVVDNVILHEPGGFGFFIFND